MRVLELFKKWLNVQGLHYECDEDGYLYFRYYGFQLYCCSKDDEPMLLRIEMPNIYMVKNNRVEVLEAANTISAEYSVVKMFLIEDYLYISLDLLIDDSTCIEDYVERYLNKMIMARNRIANLIFNK